MGPDAGVDHARVVIEPHVLPLLSSRLSSLQKQMIHKELYNQYVHCEVLEVLDGVGAVGPAVGVDDAGGDALDHAVNRVTEILRGRQHRREQDEQRERDLNK